MRKTVKYKRERAVVIINKMEGERKKCRKGQNRESKQSWREKRPVKIKVIIVTLRISEEEIKSNKIKQKRRKKAIRELYMEYKERS